MPFKHIFGHNFKFYKKQNHSTVYCARPTWLVDDADRCPEVVQQNLCDSLSSRHWYCRESFGQPSYTVYGEKKTLHFNQSSHLHVLLWRIAVLLLFEMLLTWHGNLCSLGLMLLYWASLEWNLGGQKPVLDGTNQTSRLPWSLWNRHWWWRRSYSLYDLSQQVWNQAPVKIRHQKI